MKKKTNLKSTLKKHAKKKKRRKESLWKGPEEDGITQSMIQGFLECRERFRLKDVVGLGEIDQFNHRIEYGQMWHSCEEALSKSGYNTVAASLKGQPWMHPLTSYAKELCKKYPTSQEQINHWFQVCKIQFPIYVKYWEKDKDAKRRTPLLQEQTFNVPYKLPSGRIVKLRGRWDGVDLWERKNDAGIYLREKKTKGDIKEEQLKRQLQFDIQTMTYLVALKEDFSRFGENRIVIGSVSLNKLPKINGVLYDVVRRPLSGGKGSIKQLKPTNKNPQGESSEAFYSRLGGIIAEDPSHFFMRWKVEVTPADIERFRREFLDPILEQICRWYNWIASTRSDSFLAENGIHWRTPYGCWSSLAQGYGTELDEYLATGSTAGLEQKDKLFMELE